MSSKFLLFFLYFVKSDQYTLILLIVDCLYCLARSHKYGRQGNNEDEEGEEEGAGGFTFGGATGFSYGGRRAAQDDEDDDDADDGDYDEDGN